jgi:hypothetical protein
MKSGKFDPKMCDIPTIWCGESDNPPKKRKDGSFYYKTGSRYECMKKGFGAGTHIERKSNLPIKSLQQIKYVGEKHEKDFKKAGIKTTDDLIDFAKEKSRSNIEKKLKKILTKSDGAVDARAYNCTIMFLYKNGVNVPDCKKIAK